MYRAQTSRKGMVPSVSHRVWNPPYMFAMHAASPRSECHAASWLSPSRWVHAAAAAAFKSVPVVIFLIELLTILAQLTNLIKYIYGRLLIQ